MPGGSSWILPAAAIAGLVGVGGYSMFSDCGSCAVSSALTGGSGEGVATPAADGQGASCPFSADGRVVAGADNKAPGSCQMGGEATMAAGTKASCGVKVGVTLASEGGMLVCESGVGCEVAADGEKAAADCAKKAECDDASQCPHPAPATQTASTAEKEAAGAG